VRTLGTLGALALCGCTTTIERGKTGLSTIALIEFQDAPKGTDVRVRGARVVEERRRVYGDLVQVTVPAGRYEVEVGGETLRVGYVVAGDRVTVRWRTPATVFARLLAAVSRLLRSPEEPPIRWWRDADGVLRGELPPAPPMPDDRWYSFWRSLKSGLRK